MSNCATAFTLVFTAVFALMLGCQSTGSTGQGDYEPLTEQTAKPSSSESAESPEEALAAEPDNTALVIDAGEQTKHKLLMRILYTADSVGFERYHLQTTEADSRDASGDSPSP